MQQPNRTLLITIEDTGMGIEPERLALVTRSHIKGEKRQGFGLGLSIVSRLCTRFGWRLRSTPVRVRAPASG
ncbi:MAG: sensor histidine kinase [Desulfobacter sp.]|nr:MAG: sensor histidine kinase [Desulfobacter sp.]